MRKIRVKSYSDVCIGEYPLHKQLKDELVPLLEKYPDKQGRRTNVIATMTEWDWNPENDRLNRLKNNIIEFINYNCNNQEVRSVEDTIPVKYFVNDLWGNIYRKGDYTKEHKHLPNIFSFVYFLKSKWYHSPLVFSDSGEKIRPIEGTFVIFPSHLKHLVPKHRYRETRITLSGNILIKDSRFAKCV